MTILVGYSTTSGCTEAIASWIADELRTTGKQVDCIDLATNPDPTQYDAFVIGAGVRAGKWHGQAIRWLQTHAETLKTRPVATYSVCLNVVPKEDRPLDWGEIDKYATMTAQQTGVPLVAHTALPGWWEPKEFGFSERIIMKALKAPEGDFRDEDATRAWAREISDSL